MKPRNVSVVSAIILGTVALPVAPALAKRLQTASFDVRVTVAQDLEWSEEATTRDCEGRTGTLRGSGTALLQFNTPRAYAAVFRRSPNGRGATLTFGFTGKSVVPIAGSLERAGTLVAGPRDGGSTCPGDDGNPPPRDCGRRVLPADAKVGVSYLPPGPLPNGTGVLKSPAIVLSGPAATSWQLLDPLYLNCPGVLGDGIIGGPGGGKSAPPGGYATLSMAKIFGSARQIKLSARARDQVDWLQGRGSAVASGVYPISTVTRWSVTLTRRGRSGSAPR